MEEQKLNSTLENIAENIDYILENERRILLLVDKIEGDNEELRKQLFILAQAAQRLKQEIDYLK